MNNLKLLVTVLQLVLLSTAQSSSGAILAWSVLISEQPWGIFCVLGSSIPDGERCARTPNFSLRLMMEPGQKLRRSRERLGLRYRDVEEASQRIAHERKNPEFVVGLSRLFDIENKGTIPSVYRIYSLAAIYRLDFTAVVRWYGVPLQDFLRDSARIPLSQTHAIETQSPDQIAIEFPLELLNSVDFSSTNYLSRSFQSWGKLPVALLSSLDLQNTRYAFVGTEDWSMYPIIAPGSFIQVDENRRRIVNDGWTHEGERPIYFLETRDAYRIGWCTEKRGALIVQPHPLSQVAPDVFQFPGDVDVIGQVVGVAMRLDTAKRRHTHSRANLK